MVLMAVSMLLLEKMGGYTLQVRNPDSWEGWYWGAKHVWGTMDVGMMVPIHNCFKDISENCEMLLFWGCDPETTPWGFSGQLPSQAMLLVVGGRDKTGIYLPRPELRSRRPC